MKNVILYFGEEKLLIREEINKIKNKVVPDYLETVNFITFDGKTVSEEEIINECHTVPMLEAKKLVVVYDARFFESRKKRQSDSPKKHDHFLNDLEDIPKKTYLIFTSTKADKRKKYLN